IVVFVFFQAEDGIRDRNVTGVQTCALPISAIEVADEVGLEAMTMKRVAERLSAGAMSLYRHVADKDELIAAMVEQVTEEYTYPRSEERRVGKEGTTRWAADVEKRQGVATRQ